MFMIHLLITQVYKYGISVTQVYAGGCWGGGGFRALMKMRV